MVLFGLLLVALFGFMALAIDLGRTYVVRTELQNAADAAALVWSSGVILPSVGPMFLSLPDSAALPEPYKAF